MSGPVAVLTDSTASLPPEVARRHGITVVPLQVVIGARSFDEGVPGGATPGTVADALAAWTPVSTSRPSPATLRSAYERVAAGGASHVVSIHLSAEVSGTVESARVAAREAPVPVTVVDSRQLGMATGFAVLAAADAVEGGADAAEAARVAQDRATRTTSLFYVDTLEYLRRGGRIGPAAALLGSALSVKPLLRIDDGTIAPLEKVRTASRALSRLEELAVAAAGEVPVDVAVAHLANEQRAGVLAEHLADRLGENLGGREVVLGEVGAVIGAHVGPGMVAAVVAPR
ncbi:MAG TPA: DegV family protein [Nocardioidaceae bacterium]|jgi:DegV family protein with EDD domain|nr:DegV family protein [Nocardioidaceae bacterium]